MSLPYCVATGKRLYGNFVDAQEALRRIRHRRRRGKGKREARVYGCGECGGYHLTSQAQRAVKR